MTHGRIVALSALAAVAIATPAAAQVDRPAYAFDFLRLHCDTAAGTGF